MKKFANKVVRGCEEVCYKVCHAGMNKIDWDFCHPFYRHFLRHIEAAGYYLEGTEF